MTILNLMFQKIVPKSYTEIVCVCVCAESFKSRNSCEIE